MQKAELNSSARVCYTESFCISVIPDGLKWSNYNGLHAILARRWLPIEYSTKESSFSGPSINQSPLQAEPEVISFRASQIEKEIS